MALPTPKELAELAKACRKAGISTFKGDGIEFTLEPKAPKVRAPQKVAKASAPVKDVSDDPIETSEPSETELLFWSVGPDPSEAPQ